MRRFRLATRHATRSFRARELVAMPTASLVMLVALVAFSLSWAKPVLVPIALAVLITFVHSPVIFRG